MGTYSKFWLKRRLLIGRRASISVGGDYSLILVKLKEIKLKEVKLNPFTPTNDQDRISPYNINIISSRQVIRIKKNVNHGIIS